MSNREKRLFFLLGAWASKPAGIPLAKEFINDFKSDLESHKLDYFNAETPQEAFMRRSQPEAILSRLLKGGDWYVVKWIRQAKKYRYSTDTPVLVDERGEMFSGEEEEAKEKGFYYRML